MSDQRRVFDHFLVIQAIRDSSGIPRTAKTFQLSSPGVVADEPPAAVPLFCFPDLDYLSRMGSSSSSSPDSLTQASQEDDKHDVEEEGWQNLEVRTPFQGDAFSFVLTDSRGYRIYAFCRRFNPLPPPTGSALPTCLCILSHEPLFAILPVLLEYAHVRWVINPGSALDLLKAVSLLPFPKSGDSFRIPLDLPGAADGALILAHRSIRKGGPLKPLFEVLSHENILLLFSALLCEKRVLLSSQDLATLTACIQAAQSLLYPFDWQHVYIPLLPEEMLSYTTAPMPFLLGIGAHHLPFVLSQELDEVVIVNLDKNQVSIAGNQSTSKTGGDDKFPMPKELTSKLAKRLTRGNKRSEQELSDAMFSFFVVLFGPCDWNSLREGGKWTGSRLEQFCTPISGPSDILNFLSIIQHSQFLEHFLQTEVEKINQRTGLDVSSRSGVQNFAYGLAMPLETASRFSLTLKALKDQRAQSDGQGDSKVAAETTARASVKKTVMELTSNQPPKRNTKQMLTESGWETDKKKIWHHGYKALALISHLCIHGSERLILALSKQENIVRIEKLLEYAHSDASVCQKMSMQVAKVHALLVNPFVLQAKRQYRTMQPLHSFRTSSYDSARLINSPKKSLDGFCFGVEESPQKGGISFAAFHWRSLVEHQIGIFPDFDALHASLLEQDGRARGYSNSLTIASSESLIEQHYPVDPSQSEKKLQAVEQETTSNKDLWASLEVDFTNAEPVISTQSTETNFVDLFATFESSSNSEIKSNVARDESEVAFPLGTKERLTGSNDDFFPPTSSELPRHFADGPSVTSATHGAKPLNQWSCSSSSSSKAPKKTELFADLLDF